MSNPLLTSPLSRAALVTVTATGVKQSLTFQFAPDTVRRTIEPNLVGGQPGERSRAVRYAGAANETLTFDCRFSAAEVGDGAPAHGVAPQLAALATLAGPSTTDIRAAQAALDAGTIEVLPALAPELLLVFGPSRLMPVQIVSFSIVEEVYDGTLTPVMATVSLTLRILTSSDVDAANPAWTDYLNYQQGLEQLAAPAFTAGGSGVGT